MNCLLRRYPARHTKPIAVKGNFYHRISFVLLIKGRSLSWLCPSTRDEGKRFVNLHWRMTGAGHISFSSQLWALQENKKKSSLPKKTSVLIKQFFFLISCNSEPVQTSKLPKQSKGANFCYFFMSSIKHDTYMYVYDVGTLYCELHLFSMHMCISKKGESACMRVF